MKVCSKCGVEQDIGEFGKVKGIPNGLARCKQCTKEDKAEEYKRHKERYAQQSKLWRKENKEYVFNYNAKYREQNKEKMSFLSKRWSQNNQDRRREEHLLYFYKLNLQKFYTICELQNNSCAICKSPIPTELTRYWHVDHDHKCCPDSFTCGQCTRGVLCHHCNRGLGGFKDNLDILKSAVEYLENERENVKSIRGIECDNTYSDRDRDNRESNISTTDQQ